MATEEKAALMGVYKRIPFISTSKNNITRHAMRYNGTI
jgi:hypothetical protein